MQLVWVHCRSDEDRVFRDGFSFGAGHGILGPPVRRALLHSGAISAATARGPAAGVRQTLSPQTQRVLALLLLRPATPGSFLTPMSEQQRCVRVFWFFSSLGEMPLALVSVVDSVALEDPRMATRSLLALPGLSFLVARLH